MKQKFRTAFAPNPSSKYDLTPALELAERVEYASRGPVYDASMDSKKFIAKDVEFAMSKFNETQDVVIDSGDPVLLVMMTMYLADRYDGFYFARYNVRAGKYVVTYINHAELNQSGFGEEVYDD